MVEQAVKEQERLEAEELTGREDLILNPEHSLMSALKL